MMVLLDLERACDNIWKNRLISKLYTSYFLRLLIEIIKSNMEIRQLKLKKQNFLSEVKTSLADLP